MERTGQYNALDMRGEGIREGLGVLWYPPGFLEAAAGCTRCLAVGRQLLKALRGPVLARLLSFL